MNRPANRLLVTGGRSVAAHINSQPLSVFTTTHHSFHHPQNLLGGNCQEFGSRVVAKQNKATRMMGRWRRNTFEKGKLPSLAWMCAAPCAYLVLAAPLKEQQEGEEPRVKLCLLETEQLFWNWMWDKAIKEQGRGQKAGTPRFLQVLMSVFVLHEQL